MALRMESLLKLFMVLVTVPSAVQSVVSGAAAGAVPHMCTI
jgi:hypothetical protein